MSLILPSDHYMVENNLDVADLSDAAQKQSALIDQMVDDFENSDDDEFSPELIAASEKLIEMIKAESSESEEEEEPVEVEEEEEEAPPAETAPKVERKPQVEAEAAPAETPPAEAAPAETTAAEETPPAETEAEEEEEEEKFSDWDYRSQL